MKAKFDSLTHKIEIEYETEQEQVILLEFLSKNITYNAKETPAINSRNIPII